MRLQWAEVTTEAKTNVGRCVTYPNAIILEDTKFPSEATAKNAWIKWLDEPGKRKLGCRWQFHAVGPRSSLPHPPPKSNFGDCSQWAQPSGPYVGPICLGANESHIYPNMCAIFGCGPTAVSREKGGTDTLTASMNGYRITSMAVAPPSG